MICKLQNHPFIDKLSWYDIRNVQDIIRWRDNLSHNKSWHFFTAFLCCRNIHWVRRPPIVMNRVQLKIHNHDFMFIMQCRFCNNSGLELVIHFPETQTSKKQVLRTFDSRQSTSVSKLVTAWKLSDTVTLHGHHTVHLRYWRTRLVQLYWNLEYWCTISYI